MPLWLYVLSCLVVPPTWGVAMVYLFDALDRRRKARGGAARPDEPPIDFMI